MSRKVLYNSIVETKPDTACIPTIKLRLDDVDPLEAEAQERISYSDKNIDKSRSHLNLFIWGLDDNGRSIITHKKFSEPLKKRILSRILDAGATIRVDRHPVKEGFVEHGKNTKASVIANAFSLHASHQRMMELLEFDGLLDEEGHIRNDIEISESCRIYQFFDDAYRFACSKWGKENVVGGYIHFDEYTPHLHVFVVPIIFKMRMYKGTAITDRSGKPVIKGCLCAKEVFSPEKIGNLWGEFASAMTEYGVSAAEGLAPKGAYDKAASMEAERKNIQNEIEHLNSILINQKANIRENDRRIREQKIQEETFKEILQTPETLDDYKSELDSLVEINPDDLYEPVQTGLFGSTKRMPKKPEEIALIVRKKQMAYDEKVIGTNAEIHEKKVDELKMEIEIRKKAFREFDIVLAKNPSPEIKELIIQAGVEDNFPKTFLPEKRLQAIPWFQGFSLLRLVEIEERNTTTSSGLWIDADTGRFVDNAFIDCSDSKDVYPFKVNLKKLTPKENDEINLFFKLLFESLECSIKEQILMSGKKGQLSLKKFLHHGAQNIKKEDSYKLLLRYIKSDQSNTFRIKR